MKTLLLALLMTTSLQSKEIYNYICKDGSDYSAVISLLDKKTPTIDLVYKKSKFASCSYESTDGTQPGNPRAEITDKIWRLKLKNCTYYFPEHKEKMKVETDVSFKEALKEKTPSYLSLVVNKDPMTCAPKK